MKKNVLIFGSIAGLIVSAVMAVSMMMLSRNPDFEGSMLIGYGSMLVAFAFIFVGIKNYRDKYLSGYITFGNAFLTGLLIAFVASTFYVVTWSIEYNFFIPDFMERYGEYMIAEAQKSGASVAELQAKAAEAAKYREMYKNPMWFVFMTYMEILPVGILVTLISALVLKKKPAVGQGA